MILIINHNYIKKKFRGIEVLFVYGKALEKINKLFVIARDSKSNQTLIVHDN